MSEAETKTLKDYLEEKGIMQKWLLEKLHERGHTNMDLSHLSKYVHAKTKPRNAKVYLDIAEILDLDVETVMRAFNANGKSAEKSEKDLQQ